MNREILFRGKRFQGENWVEGYFYKSDINKRERESGKATLIFTPDCDTFIYIPKALNSVMVIAETIGQYTGLTDKNGTRIFEGDILEGDLDDNLDLGAKWRSTIVMGKFGWLADDPTGTNPTPLDEFDIKEGEVIGNIYDNPELMGGNTNG